MELDFHEKDPQYPNFEVARLEGDILRLILNIEYVDLNFELVGQ